MFNTNITYLLFEKIINCLLYVNNKFYDLYYSFKNFQKFFKKNK